MQISEKEFAIIREISNNQIHDQRSLAGKAGISLGLTNLIIKRLITRGYVKSKLLNRKKIQYILTPKGFSEKASKSYNFALKAVDNFKIMKQKLQELILKENMNSEVEFIISGNSEITDIVELAIRSLNNSTIKYSRNTGNDSSSNPAVIEVISSGNNMVSKKIDVLEYLSASKLFY
ncbi:MAG: hypothetical protein A2204_07600 [Elusimicrobia bacterium RIFOXYA1_FULL_47_7]|nr:MAG: hypothetical protein A2278_01950 [Elusimicrobia bacterium RIFOXYA12_FULL_49_49]OGS06021.1 MAG: hypothetical protein A2204_07600 [Elusimicrobia bacterium RIFOXYA1_FULL_47_7]OGS16809.1 MAG: hypothetical protein A2251_05400 [Elusimicrobia bacterium RIFOXYA2_FULL_47_53]OGS32037.1 MAG: hypothetical protein A2323_08175 [Elusimicrobia bacterium RIFOXYB2_FULL_46_23]